MIRSIPVLRGLLLFYLVSALLMPLGGLVASAPVANINAADMIKPEVASEAKQSSEETQKRKNGKGDYLYLNFPDEGPEAALLADMLSKMAVRTLLNPVLRPAKDTEVIDTLTYSIYTTMVMLGTLVFGIGIIVLSWKVYNSVREAAKTEPVTLSFLCTIPGLRYLNNHFRYHLFDMPLQPRRRFASFVGASGTNLDLLDTDDDEEKKSEPSSPLAGGKNRRKSVMKPIPVIINTVKKPTDLRKRHSMVSLHTPPPSLPYTPSNSPSPVPGSTRTTSSSVAQVTEEEGEHQIDMTDDEIAAPVPMNACVVPQFNSSEELEEDSEGNFSSKDHGSSASEASQNIGASADEQPHRDWTPISTLSMETEEELHFSEDLNRKRADWVRTMPLFEQDFSAQSHEPRTESKLSRRLNTQNSRDPPGFEQSKLSRYFSPPATNRFKEAPIDIAPAPLSLAGMDKISQKLQEGDLTPPPGFSRRHSSQNNGSSSVLMRKFSFNSMLEEGEEDTVSSAPSYHAAFVSAAQKRRASFIPASQSRLSSQPATSNEQWRWFMGSESSKPAEPLWDADPDLPIRPHSTDFHRAHPAPVGSGSRSTGRITPEVSEHTKKKNSTNISLGIFDEMFPQD